MNESNERKKRKVRQSARAKPKSEATSDNYSFQTVHSETMEPHDLDSLALCLATYLYEQLQSEAIEAMKNFFPDFNPLNEFAPYPNETAQSEGMYKPQFDYDVEAKLDLSKMQTALPSSLTISFTVTHTQSDADRPGESK